MNYCQEDLISMIYVIGECYGNCLLASRIYAQKFPNRRHPDNRMLQILKERFDRTGSVGYEKRTRTKSVLNEENTLAVTLSVVENPEISVRQISRALDISKSSVGQCIKQNKFHPYHPQLHQELNEQDFEKRITFCRWAQHQITENADFVKFVLFTDECTFHRNGFVNRHNFHYYGTQNPHNVRINNFQHNWSINVWGGIVHDFVIGPYVLEQRVTGQTFLNFLREDFPNLMQHLPNFVKEIMWLQLDGAPSHFAREVREHITEQFPARWIGRQGFIVPFALLNFKYFIQLGPIAWPPRSPDLTPMDFFLWGTVKSDVYRTPATTRDDMLVRIQESFRNITPAMLRNVRTSFARRVDACLQQDGRHFEHLVR